MLHVDSLTDDSLRALVAWQRWPSVSLYIPTHRSGAISEDRTRLRNLLRCAEKQLSDSGCRTNVSRTVLEPAFRLIEDTRFWSHLSEGLSLHLSVGHREMRRLPISFPEFVAVGRTFHVKPLFAMPAAAPHFYLLALSEKGRRLYHGSRFDMQEIEVGRLPNSMAEAMHFEDLSRQLRFHTGDVENAIGVFHVQGSSSEEARIKRWLRDYCLMLDRALCEYLGRSDAYLLVSAAEPIFSIYREVHRYHRFIRDNVRADIKHATQDELHREAWRRVEAEQATRKQSLLEKYREVRAADLAAEGLTQLLPACANGQVDTLFMSMAAECWGRFDPLRNELQVTGRDAPGAQELYDLAARQAWLSGAEILVLPPSELPAREDIAGILRYSYNLPAAEAR